jgi:hypothetical protein
MDCQSGAPQLHNNRRSSTPPSFPVDLNHDPRLGLDALPTPTKRAAALSFIYSRIATRRMSTGEWGGAEVGKVLGEGGCGVWDDRLAVEVLL